MVILLIWNMDGGLNEVKMYLDTLYYHYMRIKKNAINDNFKKTANVKNLTFFINCYSTFSIISFILTQDLIVDLIFAICSYIFLVIGLGSTLIAHLVGCTRDDNYTYQSIYLLVPSSIG